MAAENVGSAIAWATSELRAAHIESPRLAAEALLAHVLKWDRAGIIAHARDLLPASFRVEFQELVRRCATGEPLQYLTGEREFYGLPFLVTPDVLIPRPETEILVEKAVELARAEGRAVRFADVGTGSGCIAVSVAHQLRDARGFATDLSQRALAVAQENARRLGVRGRVEFSCADVLECFPARPLFDFILSNPPYVSQSDMAHLPRNIRDHEPLGALDGGPSGLEIYRRLIPQASARLNDAGQLLLEIGAGQGPEIEKLIARAGLVLTETVPDLQSIPRCLIARRDR